MFYSIVLCGLNFQFVVVFVEEKGDKVPIVSFAFGVLTVVEGVHLDFGWAVARDDLGD